MDDAHPAFVALLSAAVPAAWRSPEVAARIVAAHADASARWPDVAVDRTAYVARIAEVVGQRPDAELDALAPDEQFLVAGCLTGDAAAIAAFEARAFVQLRAVAGRFSGVIGLDELTQLVRRKLLVADERGYASLRSFSGAADLATWVRVIATRIALDVRQSELRRARRHEQLPTALPEHDPELRWMRSLYTAEFQQVLDARIAALSARDRNVLRATIVHGMRVGDVATLYGVHRVTASRWLQEARDSLMQGVREELVARLGLHPDEVESVMRLIRSDVPGSAVTRGLARSLTGDGS